MDAAYLAASSVCRAVDLVCGTRNYFVDVGLRHSLRRLRAGSVGTSFALCGRRGTIGILVYLSLRCTVA